MEIIVKTDGDIFEGTLRRFLNELLGKFRILEGTPEETPAEIPEGNPAALLGLPGELLQKLLQAYLQQTGQ